MSDAIMFDNILVTFDKAVADDFAAKTWLVKHTEEKKQQDEIDRIEREKYGQVSIPYDIQHLSTPAVCICTYFCSYIG